MHKTKTSVQIKFGCAYSYFLLLTTTALLCYNLKLLPLELMAWTWRKKWKVLICVDKNTLCLKMVCALAVEIQTGSMSSWISMFSYLYFANYLKCIWVSQTNRKCHSFIFTRNYLSHQNALICYRLFPMGDMPEILHSLIAKGRAILWSSQEKDGFKVF